MSIKIGFTGTRYKKYLAKERFFKLHKLFQTIHDKWGEMEFHHGTCEGADLTAAFIFRKSFPDYTIVEHPPIIKSYAESRPDDYTEVREEKDYLDRNKDIVNESDVMIAWPKDVDTEELRSGTWSTVRYARKKDKVVIFV